jgi:hypothetical protein
MIELDDYEGFSISEIVEKRHGLLYSSRTMDEIIEDHETELAFQKSYQDSQARRHLPRYESRIVVNLLDDIDATIQRVGDLAIECVYSQGYLLTTGE